MKHRFLCLLLALWLTAFSAHAQTHHAKKPPVASSQGTPHSDSADAALVEIEKEFFAAIREKNNDKLNGILADDFTYAADGQPEMTRTQFLKYVQGLPDTIEWLGANEMHIKILGEVAIITGIRNTKIRAENGTLVSSNASFADVFRRNGDEWELALVHTVDLPAATNSAVGK